MRSIRHVITCVCLATTLSACVPSLAETAGTPGRPGLPGAPSERGTLKLDLPRLRGAATWTGQALASPRAPLPLNAQMQTAAGGPPGMSAAKKTWIIVGIVLGGAAVVAAASHHGGGGGGGGY